MEGEHYKIGSSVDVNITENSMSVLPIIRQNLKNMKILDYKNCKVCSKKYLFKDLFQTNNWKMVLMGVIGKMILSKKIKNNTWKK